MFVLVGNKLKKEAHQAPFSLHPGSIKMYRDLKDSYWWPDMKKEISEYVLTCQNVKAEHQAPLRKLYPLEILKWKRDRITMDFVSRLPRSPSRRILYRW